MLVVMQYSAPETHSNLAGDANGLVASTRNNAKYLTSVVPLFMNCITVSAPWPRQSLPCGDAAYTMRCFLARLAGKHVRRFGTRMRMHASRTPRNTVAFVHSEEILGCRYLR